MGFLRRKPTYTPTLPWQPGLDAPAHAGTHDWLAVVEATGGAPGFSAKVFGHKDGRTFFWEAWKHGLREDERKVFSASGKTGSRDEAVRRAEEAVATMRRRSLMA